MITILTIISMLVIAAYTAAVCVKTKGVPYSISATYYYLEHKLWFMATMWLTGTQKKCRFIDACNIGGK